MLFSKDHIVPTLTVAMPDLLKIDKYAIVIKGGENVIYVFVDPFCKYSKKFIKKISNTKTSFSGHYTYKIFLLKLDKFDSLDTIKYIYNQKNQLKMLNKIMVDNENIKINKIHNIDIDNSIKEISKISKKLDIYKRPYLFVVPTDWKDYEEDDDWDDNED